MGVSSLPKTVPRQHRNCDLNPGPSASSTLTTRPTFISVHAASEHYEDTFVGLLCGGGCCGLYIVLYRSMAWLIGRWSDD